MARLQGIRAVHSAAPPDQIGVAGYEILGTLGRGGMGVVYKARQVSLNRLTALKMILSGAHAGAEEIHRFRTEAEAIATLQHPNIVQIYEVGDLNGLPFFSLEYVDGGSLQAKMDGSPMSPRAAAALVAKLARAIHYAHQRGIVHRDIKPANILLTADGTPKITDFGLAKRLEVEGHTATGSILGTPSYMAPEQASGKSHEIGAPTDVYALGAMLYEMLSGRPPFRGETLIHTLQLVQTAEPLPPSRLQPRVPPDLETICLKCLQKEPQKRFSAAGNLADDLERFLAGQPIKARRTPLWERAWKWARRRPGVAALLAILAIVLVGGFFGMFGLWLNAESETLRADAALTVAQEKTLQALAATEEEAKAKQEAQGNYERAVRVLYATHMGLAQKAVADGFYSRALELLHDLEFRKDGGKDLRGFEWYYLERICKTDRLRLIGHTNLVTEVAFSRDATRLATASMDLKVIIWDVATGQAAANVAGAAAGRYAQSFFPTTASYWRLPARMAQSRFGTPSAARSYIPSAVTPMVFKLSPSATTASSWQAGVGIAASCCGTCSRVKPFAPSRAIGTASPLWPLTRLPPCWRPVARTNKCCFGTSPRTSRPRR